MRARWYNRYLMVLFAAASFISLFYEPAFFYFAGCGWQGLGQGPQGPCSQTWIGRAWLGYLQNEPIYAHAPLWIQIFNETDFFIFGWFNLLTLIILIMNLVDKRWYRNLATFMCGMMTYSLALYLWWEVQSVDETKSNLLSVFVVNGMWVLFYGSLFIRIYLIRDPRSVDQGVGEGYAGLRT